MVEEYEETRPASHCYVLRKGETILIALSDHCDNLWTLYQNFIIDSLLKVSSLIYPPSLSKKPWNSQAYGDTHFPQF